MRTARSRTNDWSLWLHLTFILGMLICLGSLTSRNRDLMEAHRESQRTIEAILNRNAIADREHALIEREIQAMERLRDTPGTKVEPR